VGDLVGDAAQQASRSPHPAAAQDHHVGAHVSGDRDDLGRRLPGPDVLLDLKIAGALALQGAVEGEVGLEIGSRRGGRPLFSRRRRRRPGIGDRDDVQGCPRQPRELDGAGESQLGGGRAVGADDDSAVDRSSYGRVRGDRNPRGGSGQGATPDAVVQIPRVAYETILYDVRDDGVATITLNQPDKRNALSNEMLSELIEALESARGDEDVRCVVLTSSHDRVFSAGASLDQFAADVPLVHKHFGTERLPRLFKTIMQLGKPTICAANGHVLAGALGVALACDLIVAKDGATFGTPEINVGVFPFMIMALIYRNVPRKKTNELLLLGERISAEEAREAGIVNRVVGADEFEAAVDDWARQLASKSPVLMRLGKEAMYRQLDMPFEDALEYLRSQLSVAFTTDDIQEGVRAFFEKRDPQWTGR
jgi:enoyl-CoA hydratase